MTRLWLDDSRPPPGPRWTWARSVSEAIRVFETEQVSEASLDYDLGEEQANGRAMLSWMAEWGRWPSERLVVHSTHRIGAPAMCSFIEREGPFRRLGRSAQFER